MDYYDDDSEPMGEQGSAQGEMDRSEDSGKTCLIDSSICPGMKPGDTFTVKIDKVLDSGEYAVSYPEGSEKEKEEPMMEESMAPESDMESVMG